MVQTKQSPIKTLYHSSSSIPQHVCNYNVHMCCFIDSSPNTLTHTHKHINISKRQITLQRLLTSRLTVCERRSASFNVQSLYFWETHFAVRFAPLTLTTSSICAMAGNLECLLWECANNAWDNMLI